MAPAFQRSFMAFALALAAWAAPAAAHEYWLAPSRYQAARGDAIAIAAFAGTGFRGEAKPFATTRAVKFVLMAGRTVDLTPVAANGDLTWARFEMPDAGGAMVAYQSNFADIQLPADEFNAYLELEGLTGPRDARAKLGIGAGPGRERYARCPKTWIAGRNPGAASTGPGLARLARPAGLPIEIVPLADPALADPLPVRVLWKGRPLAGALVRAWHTPLAAGAHGPTDAATRDSVGFTARAITDAKGEAKLAVGAAGEWMLATVHMVPCVEKREADWESWWASLTFARTAAR